MAERPITFPRLLPLLLLLLLLVLLVLLPLGPLLCFRSWSDCCSVSVVSVRGGVAPLTASPTASLTASHASSGLRERQC